MRGGEKLEKDGEITRIRLNWKSEKKEQEGAEEEESRSGAGEGEGRAGFFFLFDEFRAVAVPAGQMLEVGF